MEGQPAPRDDELAVLRSEILARAVKLGEGADHYGEPMKWILDCRELLLSSPSLDLSSRLLWQRITPSKPDCVVGRGLSGAMLVPAILLAARKDNPDLAGLVLRERPKGFGRRRLIEGPAVPRSARAVIVDDVLNAARTAASIVKDCAPLQLEFVGIATLIDNELPQASTQLDDLGLPSSALFTGTDLGFGVGWPSERLRIAPAPKSHSSPPGARDPVTSASEPATPSGDLPTEGVRVLADGRVRRELKTGAVLWEVNCARALDLPAMVLRERVWIATPDRFLLALELATGRLAWMTKLAGAPRSRPYALGFEAIVVVCEGELVLVHERGELLWREPIAPNASLVSCDGETLQIHDGRSTVSYAIEDPTQPEVREVTPSRFSLHLRPEPLSPLDQAVGGFNPEPPVVTASDFWGAGLLEDELDFPAIARRIIAKVLAGDPIPPPPRIPSNQPAAPGGVWVSIRRRSDNALLARAGHWNLNGESEDAFTQVIRASIKTGGANADQLRRYWSQAKIAVTLIGTLKPALARTLDHRRYGIVIASPNPDAEPGYVLPNSQGISSEVEQFLIACRRARIEPPLARQAWQFEVTKLVERGETWLPYGAPSAELSGRLGTGMAGHSLTTAALESAAGKGPPHLVDLPVSAVGVSFYKNGRVGCATSWKGTLGERLDQAARAAIRDPRLAGQLDEPTGADAVVVSLIHDPMPIHGASLDYFARTIQKGQQAMSVRQGQRFAVFLESVLPQYYGSIQETLQQLEAKAGIHGGVSTWTSYQAESWIRVGSSTRHMRAGYPERSTGGLTPDDLGVRAIKLASFIHLSIGTDGLPAWRQFPVTGKIQETGRLAHAIHALHALALAGQAFHRPEWSEVARAGLSSAWDLMTDPGDAHGPWRLDWVCKPLLLRAASLNGALPKDVLAGLREEIVGSIREDGRIRPPSAFEDQDYLPGLCLLALSETQSARSDEAERFVEESLPWYQRRFRESPQWGAALWYPLAWSAVSSLTRRPEPAQFAFEVTDWAISWQLRGGDFLTNLDPVAPSFHTACVAEAVAASWSLALETGDEARVKAYRASWEDATRFMERLIIEKDDTYCMKALNAEGGVRRNLTTSEVRIDAVSHTLFSTLAGHALLEKLED